MFNVDCAYIYYRNGVRLTRSFQAIAYASLKPVMIKKRCRWVGESNPLMLEYHDREWGVPVHDDSKHFEFLVLEAAQAGLSWSIVLNKREGYRRAFSGFDPNKVARYTEKRFSRVP